MNCHCGKPLHYTNLTDEEAVKKLIRAAGDEYVRVTVGDRVWRVQRHYIALHGLRAEEIDRLGFEEITG